MQKNILTTLLCAFLLINNLRAQDSARIKNNFSDSRIKLLSKTWYLKPLRTQDNYAVYTNQKLDSAIVVLEIHSDGTFRITGQTQERKGNWILHKEDLYLQTPQNKNEYARYEIQRLNDTALVESFQEVKNITEPFLCSRTIFQITEIPAQFGQRGNAFEEYIKTAFSIEKLKDKSDQNVLLMEFVVTCEGEIYVPFSLKKRSELEDQIITVLKKMPKWTPAVMNGQRVDELKKYRISLTNGKLGIQKYMY